jgi:hypothetical protein
MKKLLIIFWKSSWHSLVFLLKGFFRFWWAWVLTGSLICLITQVISWLIVLRLSLTNLNTLIVKLLIFLNDIDFQNFYLSKPHSVSIALKTVRNIHINFDIVNFSEFFHNSQLMDWWIIPQYGYLQSLFSFTKSLWK